MTDFWDSSRIGKSKQRSVIRDSDSQENITNKCIQIEGYLATEDFKIRLFHCSHSP